MAGQAGAVLFFIAYLVNINKTSQQELSHINAPYLHEQQ